MARMKICGLTAEPEIELVAGFPVGLVGLWHGTAGRHELSRARLARMAAKARAAGTVPCMVTLSHDPRTIADALTEAEIGVVQLHGFCLPPQIAAIRAAVEATGRQVEILKVLHVADGRCLEERLIPSYLRSGADGFILDAFGGRDSVGSTGKRVAIEVARRLCAALSPRPVLLAGGIDALALGALDMGDRFAGFDIDSGARSAGRLCRDRIEALTAALSRLTGGQRHAA